LHRVKLFACSFTTFLFVSFHQWITNEYLHCGIREAGATILERLLNFSRGGTLLR
jgi:hypothetical protein